MYLFTIDSKNNRQLSDNAIKHKIATDDEFAIRALIQLARAEAFSQRDSEILKSFMSWLVGRDYLSPAQLRTLRKILISGNYIEILREIEAADRHVENDSRDEVDDELDAKLDNLDEELVA